MKAKDTVMSEDELDKIWVQECEMGFVKRIVCKAQAEISFNAGLRHGLWLFAWWKDGVQYVGTSGMTLEKAYKKLGIE